MKYAAIGDEGIDSPFMDSEDEVKQWLADNTGEDWMTNELYYRIQMFTDEEIAVIENQPDV